MVHYKYCGNAHCYYSYLIYSGDQAYCEPCFQELYGLICETCQEYITGTVLEVHNIHIHMCMYIYILYYSAYIMQILDLIIVGKLKMSF